MTCKYLDCGWCYAPTGVKTNNSQGECIHPECCPYFKSQMTFNTEIQKTEKEIAVLQAKLDLLKEIEIHKSQPKMKFLFDGKFEVVSYNKKSYYRFEFSDEIYWYRRTSHETHLDLKLERITDGETHRLLDGLWFNEVKRGKYDEQPTNWELKKQTPEEVAEGLHNAFRQAKKDGVFDIPKKGTLYDIIADWWDEIFINNNPSGQNIESLIGQIEEWLPKKSTSCGDYYEGWDNAIARIRSKLK